MTEGQDIPAIRMKKKKVAHVSLPESRSKISDSVSKLNSNYSLPIVIHIDEKLPPPLDHLAPISFFHSNLSPSSKAKHLDHTSSIPFSAFCSTAPGPALQLCECFRGPG